jgi:hypothetical protein
LVRAGPDRTGSGWAEPGRAGIECIVPARSGPFRPVAGQERRACRRRRASARRRRHASCSSSSSSSLTCRDGAGGQGFDRRRLFGLRPGAFGFGRSPRPPPDHGHGHRPNIRTMIVDYMTMDTHARTHARTHAHAHAHAHARTHTHRPAVRWACDHAPLAASSSTWGGRGAPARRGRPAAIRPASIASSPRNLPPDLTQDRAIRHDTTRNATMRGTSAPARRARRPASPPSPPPEPCTHNAQYCVHVIT